ncbi:sulfite oxidase-like oxidoreductase [Vitiosangium sp. GDMCC 1.1324]|uniref:sulfite oxidase-like oxidoreductase n=1 Tax=Vitiosangium sp. (strain GDMCC 1.1324) TaxID=2138576 RepID=UPI000D3579FE|nr:sulfite oxidase-like oxidoreductase [Vitiosangium sp. GDMCC 1.1324]PTL77613.1 oxidoreductase [Vitiosangium sp. GDMCC 1.1324]
MSALDDKQQRIIEARLKLRARYLEKMARTPGVSDERPQGSGPPNRHGMPKLPPGQTQTRKWPVLDLGAEFEHPSLEQWELRINGAVEQPVTLSWKDFLALPQHEDTSDFHCVTGWSLMDVRWVGVQLSTLAALARPLPEAGFILAHAYDGYTTNLALEEALKDDVLLVHTYNGQQLPREHGGPVRMITPQLYAWKGAKWIRRIEFLRHDSPGFWERSGYSNTAHPWRDDRYS